MCAEASAKLDWLSWFNAERPHHALALKTPLDIL
jgi:hypothetical protein